jgi:glycosyltransferase involved in cell wall biosynthesis
MLDSYWSTSKSTVEESSETAPTVSVIVTIHNAEKTLATCLDSLLNQTFDDIEIICVDDSSTDRSLEIAQHYAELDEGEKRPSRFTIIQSTGQGLAAARNAGLDVARGKFISFVDGNDFMHIEAYKRLLAHEEHRSFDVLIFGGFIVDDNENDSSLNWVRTKLSPHYHHYVGKTSVLKALFHEESARPFVWLHLIKRSILESPSPLRFDENRPLSEDELFQFSYFLRAEDILFVEDKFYCYRIIGDADIYAVFDGDPASKLDYQLGLIEAIAGDLHNRDLLKAVAEDLIIWITNLLFDGILSSPLPERRGNAQRLTALYKEIDIPLYFIPDVHVVEKAEYIERIAEGSITEEVLDVEDDLSDSEDASAPPEDEDPAEVESSFPENLVETVSVPQESEEPTEDKGESNASKEWAGPQVSVIVPIHNAEKTLATCLDSLVNQTLDNIEIICVDDGSTDRSLEVVQHYARLDEREDRPSRFILVQQENQGPAAARNTGLVVASGKFISFVDSDDFMHVEAYEKLLAYEKNYDFDIIVFGGYIIDDDNSDHSIDWVRAKLNPEGHYYQSNEQVIKALFHEESARPFIWLHLIRRGLLEEPEPLRFDADFPIGEDQLFQFSYFLRAENVLFVEDRFYCYRVIGNTGIMSKFYKMPITKIEYHFKLVEAVVNEFEEHGFLESAGPELVIWLTNFFHDDIVRLPFAYQQNYAQRLSALYDRINVPLFYVPDVHVMEKAENVVKIAEGTAILELDSIGQLKKEIKALDKTIHRALNSKALRMGRAFTGPGKRNLPERAEIETILKKRAV